MASKWQFWIDRGGTFTDCLGRSPDGQVRFAKVLSCDRAPLIGIRQLLGIASDAPVPPSKVRMGTTVATNALLERKGRACGLVISRGFGDLLTIGTQARPELFALVVRKPEPLYQEVVEIDARASATGEVLERPDSAQLLEQLQQLRRRVDSVAVVVMHAYCAPALEREVGQIARQAGFDHVALSHELAAEIGMLARGDTAVVDAYLTPLLHDYLTMLQRELPGSELLLMQSRGGLAAPGQLRGPAAVLSGPAGGVVACARIAKACGLEQVIGFDMGGTSTDVSRLDAGEPEWTYETLTAGVRIRAPMVAVHTVAAGGGSICRFDTGRLLVGPQSAGALPGPLCYGRPEAQALTVTDINVLLGRVLPDQFPFSLQSGRAARAAEQLAREASMPSVEALAAGFFAVANQHMAEAIKKISVARGYDLRGHALMLFGGAAGQHGCALARSLGIETVLVHPFAGVLSAYGMGLADLSWHGEQDLGRRPLAHADGLPRATAVLDRLENQGRSQLAAAGVALDMQHVSRKLDLRYQGTETALTLPLADLSALRDGFVRAHQRLFGYARPGQVVELVSARVQVRGGAADLAEPALQPTGKPPAVLHHSRLYDCQQGCWRDAPVYERSALRPGQTISGPALVVEATTAVVVDEGFTLEVDAAARLWLRALPIESGKHDDRPSGSATGAGCSTGRDPVQLELFHNQFASIAEQMGHVLRRTALSTNIRERLDFSCALFDGAGGLVANAPHIPVHLGAMEQSVKAVLRAHPNPLPADAFLTNDPAAGGSHLPDLTVVTPLFDAVSDKRFFVASRGHHADIGGLTPGSMPPHSRLLREEGIVFPPMRIVRHGVLDEQLLVDMLRAGPYPARDPAQNLADLEAQLAANQKGAQLLEQLCGRVGAETVATYMSHVQDNAADKVAAAISGLPDGTRTMRDTLDDGSPICVSLRVAGGRLEVDFAGTGPPSETNLNAPTAVTVAALIYVLRLLVGEPIPLASGCLRPVELRIPEPSLLAPEPHRAVAAGNVETSQRIVDVLLGALGLCAASQGTMNNLSFGDERYGYYETLGGGCGATADSRGASAVQSHMTNTRITDPEVLESRFPVRLIRFAVRCGSGGTGAQVGGDGLIRCFEALAPMTVSILSERRNSAPFGLQGGGPGKPGRNVHLSVSGQRELDGKTTIELAVGERISIETPGGGGFG